MLFIITILLAMCTCTVKMIKKERLRNWMSDVRCQTQHGQRTLSQSSQLTEPLWTDPGTKSGISVCKLISTLKKKKAGGNEWSYILLKFLQSLEKATTTVIHWGLSTNVAKWQEKNFPAASMYNCLGSLAS